MHELSIAMSVIDIAKEYAVEENASSVAEIEIEVGDLSGVILEALEFAMGFAVKETILEKAICRYIKIPGRAKCKKCSHEFETENLHTPCPECGAYDQDIISGRELRVKSLIVD
jgi:hydrogenase nickel incorporation protein HypA/HybF